MNTSAMPEKIAPTTKYGARIVECQPACIVVDRIHDVTV
jgi:hypothetical protein